MSGSRRVTWDIDGDPISSGNPMPVGQAAASTETATIANGESLSGAVDCGNKRLAGIHMPADWTAADLTFQGSSDGTTFNNLYDKDGVEYTVDAADDRYIIVPLADFIGIRHLKIRSGTSGSAVAQGASRALTLVLQ